MQPADAQSAEIQRCEAPVLFRKLEQQAQQDPATALACVSVLDHELRRDAIFRAAFTAALKIQPETAVRYLPQALKRPWIGSVGFHAAIDLAPRLDAALAKEFARVTALANTALALREPRALKSFGLLEELILAAPDEAAAVAAGSSPTSSLLREGISSTPLAALYREPLPLPLESRVALLLGRFPLEEARRIAADDRLFLLSLNQDGARERTARQIVLTLRTSSNLTSLAKWNAKELYLLLVYGREELDAPLFQSIFDRYLKGKPIDSDAPRLRAFLSDAVAFQRMNQLPSSLARHAFVGIESLEDMVQAADILDHVEGAFTPDPANPLHQLIAGRKNPAHPYHRFFDTPAALREVNTFSAQGSSLHRYFFYNDDDGRESFATFRDAYRNDPRWHWQQHPGYIRLSRTASRGRSIVIYANLPDQPETVLPLPGEPHVLVHRGHAWHLDKTLQALTPTANLVYLGSCRGTERVARVLEVSRNAQVIATSGTGSKTINDPLLKAINDAILDSEHDLNWASFWQTQNARFRGSPLFLDYIAPHRNNTALLLRALRAWLADTHVQ